jgi:uncharacterized membrane protein YraQ (UPF0718 family)
LKGLGKRQLILFLFILLVSFSFWAGSRYPDLVEKGQAGSSMVLDGIGFDSVFAVSPQDSWLSKVLKRTVNWLDTNKKGMLFGLILAAAAATFLSLIKRKQFGSFLGNTLLGVAIGAPMGLCVNCAAPVGTGMHQSGSRLETSTAAVMASPTLNILVLSMLFSLLPWHLALLKTVLTLLLLFVGLPLIIKDRDKTIEVEVELCPASASQDPDEGWLQALKWSLREIFKNFLQLLWKVGPLMLLAGALGSALITLLPLDALAEVKTASVFGIVALALIGTFLPVPVAFDVIMCSLLYQATVPSGYVMVLLFTLGTFSVYSFAVFRQTISRPVAGRLFMAVVMLGILGGLAAGPMDRWYRRSVDQRLLLALRQALSVDVKRPSYRSSSTPEASSFGALKSEIERGRLSWEPISAGPGFQLEKRAFLPSETTSGPLFQQRPGQDFGLLQDVFLSFREHMWIPTSTNRALASGDIHHDGWADLVVANDNEVGGLTLYANIGGHFKRQELVLGSQGERPVFVVVTALVDINGDGWLDLYWSDVLGRNRVLLNEGGDLKQMIELPTLPEAFVNTIGFGDFDLDGDLDMVAGTWVHRFMRQELYRGWNYVWLQGPDLQFESKPLPGDGGNTNAVLLSDLNQDGKLDLVVGNDFIPPDEFYWGLGDGNFLPMGADAVPISTESTMSLDSGDLNNDLLPELLIAQIAHGKGRRARLAEARGQDRSRVLPRSELDVLDLMLSMNALHDRNRLLHSPAGCLEAESMEPHELSDCLFDTVLSRTWRRESREMWLDLVPQDDALMKELFERVYPLPAPAPQRDFSHRSPVPSKTEKNVLLELPKDKFINRAEEWGLEITFWTWNARFADFNLDGFLDLYAVNGSFQEELLTPNLLFLNDAGKTLLRSDQEGAADYFPTSNSTYLDFDNDGDLDIITSPPNGAMRVFLNQRGGASALALELVDLAGIRNAVGARVILHTAQGRQIREVKASGGYDSFDDLRITFGLGDSSAADKIEVLWPNGGRTVVSGPLSGQHLYRVTRTKR